MELAVSNRYWKVIIWYYSAAVLLILIVHEASLRARSLVLEGFIAQGCLCADNISYC